VLDCLFVISNSTPYVVPHFGLSNQNYDNYVMSPLSKARGGAELVFYNGVTFYQRTFHGGMFSFFPCMTMTQQPYGFQEIEIPLVFLKSLGLEIRRRTGMMAKGVASSYEPFVWKELSNFIIKNHYKLGVGCVV
jgi:hypothetical protein